MRTFLAFLLGVVLGFWGGDVLAQDSTPESMLTPLPMTSEELFDLLKLQHVKLKEVKKNARDVLFFSGGMPRDKSGYCKQFWNAIETQERFDVPKPDMIADDSIAKDRMFLLLRDYAKSNFSRYISQHGALSLENYKDVEGNIWRLGPYRKGGLNDPKDLHQKFEKIWRQNAYSYGFFKDTSFLDKDLSTYILYLEPYPIHGYLRPTVITLVKDQCDNCTGLSMGLRIVGVDGLPQPDMSFGEYFSQATYTTDMTAVGPFLLMGLGMFDHHLTFWTLKQQTQMKPSAREIDESLGYYKSGDAKDYFRDYVLDVIPLEDSAYQGPRNICSVQFN